MKTTELLQNLFYNPNAPLIFNSVLFLLLFTLLYSIYVFVYNRVKLRNVLLLAFSLFFYYKISGYYVFLLILMGSSDYFIGKGIASTASHSAKKGLMIMSILLNIGALVFFKYINFFLNTAFGIASGEPSPVIINLIMPIGISFYVFKTLSYIFDLYRETIEEPEKNYINYLLYVSFFPNILAGPIAKARDLLPQFRNKLNLDKQIIGKALLLILIGAFKKIFIADYLGANLINRVFDSPEFFTSWEGLMVVYAYAIQIYCDFSGYTDIVIGIATLLGFTVQPNFNKPFLADNVANFWRRWHITLSSWFNEYLFYPLSYSFRRMKQFGAIIAILVTFFVSGVWHGPNWTYILWGTSHGIAIAFTIATINIRSKITKHDSFGIYKFLSIFITFHFLAFSMVLFRADSFQAAMKIYKLVFTNFDIGVAVQWARTYTLPLAILLFGYFLHFTPVKWYDYITCRFVSLHWTLKALVLFLGILLIYQAYSSDTQPFIYLEF